MLSFIFDRLTDPLGLPLPAWQEYIVLAGINEIARFVAYYLTGELYRSGDIHSGLAGKGAHWGFRFLTFLPVWAVTYAAIIVFGFVRAHSTEVLVGVFVVFWIAFVAWDLYRKRPNNA